MTAITAISVKRSIEIGPGCYQYEFIHGEDRIAVAKWGEPPSSTLQWVHIQPINGITRFRLEGTCNEDLRVVQVEQSGEDSQ